MFSATFNNCFDSHVHWLGTGQQATRLLLHDLKSAEDIRHLRIEPHHYQGEWLVGFGWDQNKWEGQQFPNRTVLDELFPNTPVAFSRADGHATWCNSEALIRAGILLNKNQAKLPIGDVQGGKILVDEKGLPTGLLIDAAEKLVDNIIPIPTDKEIRAFLLKGIQEFNHSGFTHIRDLTCTEEQWQQQVLLEDSGLLTLAVEEFFGAYTPNDFIKALQSATHARQHPSKLMRVKGVKIFYDGALGSEGAFLSRCYCSGSGRGLVLLTELQLQEFMLKTWSAHFEIAVHVIGDEAAHQVAKVAAKLWQAGHTGHLHLEHVEMLRPETIALLNKRFVTCHMQPCHWHTDKRWLKDKLGDLFQFVFPWRALQEAEIPFFFGSDTPIEKSSVLDNLTALLDSQTSGVPKLLGSPFEYHQHPDPNWTPNTYSHFEDGRLTKVIFQGEHLL